jgi:hypothetical protein
MREVLNLVLNILWFFFCGIWLAIAYALAALICFVLIITIPFGIASFRLAGYALWPFGRTIAAYRVLRHLALRPHRGAARGRWGRVLRRQRDLAGGGGHLAGHRARRDQHRFRTDHHRHPLRLGEPEADPDLADAARDEDRPQRPGLRELVSGPRELS